MTTITVWLLIMSGYAHSGGLGAVQPFMFATLADCENVAKSAYEMRPERIFPVWRCVQTKVVKP